MARNPFTPNFGQVPVQMAGRTLLVDDMTEALENGLGDPNLCTLFKGARGTGKTALLHQLAQQAEALGWIAVSTTALPGMLEDLYEQAVRKSSHLVDGQNSPRLKALSLGQVVGAERDNPAPEHLNWRSRMTRILDALAEHEVGLLITVDEIDPALDELVQLAVVYQHFIGENRTVALLMAGLPFRISNLLSGASTSFLRRANQVTLGRVADEEVADALEQTALLGEKAVQAAALAKAVDAIEGFPFMLQLVGYRSWKAAGEVTEIDEEAMDRGIALARADLRDRVLTATLNELSGRDLDVLEAMLQDEESSPLEAIAERTGMTSGNASTYKRRLLEQGVIDLGPRNELRFALPYLREYLLEYLEG